MTTELAGQGPVDRGVRRYPLEVENVGEDTYILMSKGHHDVHEFMRAVRADYSWPLGMPTHEWMRAIPAPANSGCRCLYVKATPGARGAFPATYVREAWGDDRYEVLVARSYPACKGRNCGCTDGRSHSAECQEEHEDACNGVLGPCSVPMWFGSGCPAGTCGNKAYGKRPPSRMWMNYGAGRMMRDDLKFDGFAPGLACPVHGGPEGLTYP